MRPHALRLLAFALLVAAAPVAAGCTADTRPTAEAFDDLRGRPATSEDETVGQAPDVGSVPAQGLLRRTPETGLEVDVTTDAASLFGPR